MLSQQAGAVLLNTFSNMQKKCFNYFELNWKFICKRVIFKKYQHCFSPNSEWILSFKKKEKKNKNKKTPQSALTCVAGGIRVDVFPFFSRLIAKFIPLALSAWRFHQLSRLSAYRIAVCRSWVREMLWPTASLFFSLSRSQFNSQDGEHLLYLGLVLPHQQSSLLLLINRKIWASCLMTFVSA